MALAAAFILTLAMSVPSLAFSGETIKTAVNKATEYMISAVKAPQVGSVGGEWAVIGLARGGYKAPEYYRNYYASVEKYVKTREGVLHERKYTEYSRVIIALTAIGKDPADVAGYNLLTPLGDYDKTIWQGLNGPIWALIALDAGGWPMPENPDAKTQATRDMYVDRILECQSPDGGFSLFNDSAAVSERTSDPDITGMALQALAKYQNRSDVKKSADNALAYLSNKQDENGGFSSWRATNSESVVQVIVALCELGVPLDDARFVKNGKTTLDNLLTYQTASGGFLHASDGDGKSNQMASEQGLYGLVAALRASEKQSALYHMSGSANLAEIESASYKQAKGAGLKGKNANIKSASITDPEAAFSDIASCSEASAIEALASRGIIAGMGDGAFLPDAAMTRAQFAVIIVNALGLAPKANNAFSDVSPGQWHAAYIGAANAYGIARGKTTTLFDPDGIVTRQEAAVMTANAARLCGMDVVMDAGAVRDALAPFSDYTTSSNWARTALAFCYSADILSQRELSIRPQDPIKRAETARMLFNLLDKANLL
jgi:hypothetical protein